MTNLFTDIEFPDTLKYSSDSDHIPLAFYEEAFPKAKHIDLLLGYFSTNAFKTLASSFAEFIYNGGTMRIVTNHYYALRDKEELFERVNLEFEDRVIPLDDIEKLQRTFSKIDHHFFDCLRYLQKMNRLQIVPVMFNNVDLSHSKEMILSDGKNWISTDGSINFTTAAILKNSESFEVNISWTENTTFNARIDQARQKFDDIFKGKHEQYRHLKSDELEVVIQKTGKNKELDELLEDSIEFNKNTTYGSKVAALIEKKKKRFDYYVADLKGLPRFPFRDGPRDYQSEAYEKWIANGKSGVFAMATGTGKTITSLNCLLNEYNKTKEGVYHAIILAPTITLVDQWEKEANAFNFDNVIKVSSKQKWESRLATTLSTAKRIPTSFVVIGTYASFIRKRFFKYINQLPIDTIFIADEAHNIGSKSVMSKLKDLKLERRIGLSATPKRIYDPQGSAAMESFFRDSEPYTYSFSMEKAISDNILCQYDYHPHLIELTAIELEEYVELTKKLARLYIPGKQSLEASEIAERLLLKRKRIIHKAENKLPKTLEILRGRYKNQGNLLYTFVYVPEGYVTNYADDDDVTEANEENLRIINQYTSAIGSIDPKVLVNQFISGMKDRDEILTQFKSGRIQVLASMKCLDEGVDIPRAEHAIFCSSTGNPRQFIQRRGRILRQHDDKHKAVIHDLVVIPDLSKSGEGSATYNLERNMVKKEIERVMYFASLSNNPFETERLFEDVCNHYDLNIYTIYNELQSP